MCLKIEIGAEIETRIQNIELESKLIEQKLKLITKFGELEIEIETETKKLKYKFRN